MNHKFLLSQLENKQRFSKPMVPPRKLKPQTLADRKQLKQVDAENNGVYLPLTWEVK